MKKSIVSISVFLAALLIAAPAFAINHVENTSCKGPSRIFFDKKIFEHKYSSAAQAPTPCLAKYTTALSSSDGHADDWAPYAVFYSQLIATAQDSLKETLQTRIPQRAVVDKSDFKNPSDGVISYRVIKKEATRDLLRYVLVRALKQSDQTIRVYQFEVVMQADTHAEDGTKYNAQIPQHAYTHFNTVIQNNRSEWLRAIQDLDTQD